MGIDVADLFRAQPRALQGKSHRLRRASAAGGRLHHVVRVVRGGVAGDLGQHARPAPLGMCGALQNERRATFAKYEAVPLGIERPRIAVAGLNPHAGEAGLFGDEEIRIIRPAIAAARAEGIDASGPWPGDTVFMQARNGRFDIVVAQYHDQGLIPVKYLGLERGVNITLGLPFVRTSPDHGTAFDIAGRGIADATSLQTAIDYARRLAGTSSDQE